jgi:O-antigen ligase
VRSAVVIASLGGGDAVAIRRATIAAGPACRRSLGFAAVHGAALPVPLAVAGVVQGLAVLVAAAAAAAVLLAPDPRRRAAAMLAAPVVAVLALATTLRGGSLHTLRAHALEAAGAGALGLLAVVALALLMRRRPAALALLAVAALPFRVPVIVGGGTASLLLPLYGVIAAGCLAFALPQLRRPAAPAADGAGPREPWVRRLELALAAVVVLYALQSLYSTDVPQAAKNVCFFYVPFAVLFRLLLDLRWSPRALTACLRVTIGLALAFAVIGFGEFATGRLLLTNTKVLEANELKPYFRVNSLFFDPNIYGRFLALSMVLLAAVLLWTRRPRTAWLIGGALLVLWAGMVLSLSQSSFAALLAGLAVLAALRWRPWPVAAAVGAAGAAAVALVFLAPGVLHIEGGSSKALDKATSGRVELVHGAVSMFRDRPLDGFGSGAFQERYRVREHVRSGKAAAISHTTPLTVAAEQGLIGLAAYVALLAAAAGVLFGGLRAALRRERPGPVAVAVARAGLAAATGALVLHTLVYAAFLEDPLLWTLLAIAAALRRGPPQAEPATERIVATSAASPAPLSRNASGSSGSPAGPSSST